MTNDNIKEKIDAYISDFLKDKTITTTVLPEYSDIPTYLPNNSEYKSHAHIKKIVASGGGTRGYGLIGALQALEEMNILNKIEEFVGVSAGAGVLAFYVLGLKPLEIHHLIRSLNLSKLQKLSIKNLPSYGLDDGFVVEYVIQKVFKKLGIRDDITMLELFHMTNKKLIFGTVNVNTMQYEYLSCITYPNLSLKKALRMTSCIPLLFSPINHNNCLYVDGGIINNMPIEYYHDKIDDVLGIYLYDNNNDYVKIDDMYTYFTRVTGCFFQTGLDTKIKSYGKNIVFINLGSSIVEFNMANKSKDDMFLIGYNTMLEKLS